MKYYKVLIDGVENELYLRAGMNKNMNHYQYNTRDNYSAHNFNTQLSFYPKNTSIKTNGHTYIIL